MRTCYTSLSAVYIFEEFCNEDLSNFLNQKHRHPSNSYSSFPLLPFCIACHHQSSSLLHHPLLSSYQHLSQPLISIAAFCPTPGSKLLHLLTIMDFRSGHISPLPTALQRFTVAHQ